MSEKRKITIRIGHNTLSFTMLDPTDRERPVVYEPFVVKGGISMAANLREAFKRADLMEGDIRRAQVLLDTPAILVPVEQFEEDAITELFDHAIPDGQEPRKILFNVLPDLKTVCLFAINKDLWGVVNDRFDDTHFIQSMTPVWRHLHQRSYTGHHAKLYGCFHEGRLDLFAFQQNRFKFCNSFEASHANDALYFLLYVWKQLRLDTGHDELHLTGEIPEQEALTGELRQYVQKVYTINPSVDFLQAPATKIAGMPYDLMTLIVKGR